MKENREISKVWVTGRSSYTIVIPKKFALELNLDSNSHLVIERVSSELRIRKLEVPN